MPGEGGKRFAGRGGGGGGGFEPSDGGEGGGPGKGLEGQDPSLGSTHSFCGPLSWGYELFFTPSVYPQNTQIFMEYSIMDENHEKNFTLPLPNL